jgi:hypothetical protein
MAGRFWGRIEIDAGLTRYRELLRRSASPATSQRQTSSTTRKRWAALYHDTRGSLEACSRA